MVVRSRGVEPIQHFNSFAQGATIWDGLKRKRIFGRLSHFRPLVSSLMSVGTHLGRARSPTTQSCANRDFPIVAE